jgi:hypothetical protein
MTLLLLQLEVMLVKNPGFLLPGGKCCQNDLKAITA